MSEIKFYNGNQIETEIGKKKAKENGEQIAFGEKLITRNVPVTANISSADPTRITTRWQQSETVARVSVDIGEDDIGEDSIVELTIPIRNATQPFVPDEPDVGQNGTKLIIYWSERPRNDIVRFYDRDRTGFAEFSNCKWSNCELSRDRRRVREATVIVYRQYDPYPDWPAVRFSNQTYVHLLSDRPCAIHWWLPKFDDRINLTLNYRRDADIPHHKIARKKDHPAEKKYVPVFRWENKTKSIVWAVSDCQTASKREDYVAELSKHIDIDVYGSCGSLTCPREQQNQCSEIWEKKYKFYLAFENSICDGYITEKFYRTLSLELVPVVFGGGDYVTAGPPHSYINVRDYETPKDLAEYLHELAKDKQKYYEYFRWKQIYVIRPNINRSCKLCEVAHNIGRWSRPARHDYNMWWMSKCHNNLLDRMRRRGMW
ncbi:hypothetical protein LSH36_440g00002 [Paralvinella palmiformis]|uniref:Fucosyltransferase n=1 Tax=Paralvinella palmiformis TaxID=53620 RepID=A0AAD9MZR2_9ANNE|nr:hypothetical protein LSH36_440g00002 [Paralvinella palmiformis]